MFKSITNKIATMLIVALVASFAAISAVSYYTARDKVVELVSQTQDQILSDIKITTDTFFEDYLGAAKSLADNSKNQHDEDDLLKALVFEKSQASSVVGDIYFGREIDGHYFQSDNTKTTPEKDNYDPRTKGWCM